jgi:hypothetical protein
MIKITEIEHIVTFSHATGIIADCMTSFLLLDTGHRMYQIG